MTTQFISFLLLFNSFYSTPRNSFFSRLQHISSHRSNDVDDCYDDCSHEFSDRMKYAECKSICLKTQDTCPYSDQAECDSKYGNNTWDLQYIVSWDDYENLCDIICPRSVPLWLILIIGAVALILISVVCYVTRCCFKCRCTLFWRYLTHPRDSIGSSSEDEYRRFTSTKPDERLLTEPDPLPTDTQEEVSSPSS